MPILTEQQRKAVESIDKNVLVSAGAGSGKTMVLVERYLEVLRIHADATISDIIAVTFTRKAAEEMRSRLKGRLKQISSETQGEEKKRWSKLLAAVDGARIGTIHSLCESVLKSFPAEAGIDPQFELLDDLARAELINESIESSLQDLFSTPDEDQLALLEFPVEHIRNWVFQQLQNAPQYKQSRVMFGEKFENLIAHAQSVVERVQADGLRCLIRSSNLASSLEYLDQHSFHDPKSALEIRRREVLTLAVPILKLTQGQCLRQTEADKVSNAPDLTSRDRAPQSDDCTCPRCTAQRVSMLAQMSNLGTAGGPAGKPLRDAISAARKSAREFVDGYPAQLNESDTIAFPLMRALLRLIDSALDQYEQAKLKCQKVDYNDLILATHQLVCRPDSAARKFYATRLKAILVDEFQDTNHTQAQLLAALCGTTSRLFLIGDDKQSIYKFQGADVSTFNGWKDLIGSGSHSLAGEGLLLDLSYSFRSHPTIVNFVNEFFRIHFASNRSDEPPHRARHQALIPSRTDTPAAERVELVIYDAMGEQDKRDAEQARSMESRAIAAWIWEKIAANTPIYDKEQGGERPMSFGDFAILVPTNNDFGSIETALAESSIPYVTFAGAGFLNRQEVSDIENMLRWFKCPEDNYALLAVLRSPFFGINDGVLHRVNQDFDGSLWNAVQRASKNSDFDILRRPVALLRQLETDAHKLALGELVRTIITLTNYDIVTLSLPNGKQKSRNVWKMANFAHEHSHLTIAEFLAALDAMRKLGAGKQTDAPLSSNDSVKLMTIHKSKGLEFPTVILPVLGRKTHQSGAKLLVHRDFGAALDTSRSKDDLRPAFFQSCATINAEFEEAERKRLLYVAMTRARDFLGIFFERYAKNEQSFRLWLKNAISMDCDDQCVSRAALIENEHYHLREIDESNLASWELASAAFKANYVTSHEIDKLAQATNFTLLAPLVDNQSLAEMPVAASSLTRVTDAGTNGLPSARTVGTFFHLTMQYIAIQADKPDRKILEKIAATAQVNAAHGARRQFLIAEGERLLSKFYQSPLAEMLKNAQRVMHEVSYMLVSQRDCLEKRPDLIFQDRDGSWHLVDFKTDKLATWQLAEKMNEHSAQVLDYVRDFEKIAQAKPTGWLYFAELGLTEKVQSAGYAVAVSGQLRLPLPG